MNQRIKLLFLYLLALSIAACEPDGPGLIDSGNRNLSYSGRIDQRSDGTVALIGSGSSVYAHLSGTLCTVLLRNAAPAGQYNYVVFELNGEYLGRFRVDGDSVKSFPIVLPADKKDHSLTISKATEPVNGNIIFKGISGTILKPVKVLNEKTIEFIGNSITCGMGVDTKEIPCKSRHWYDQHNAYWSYGSILSRVLNVKGILTSVSGIGVYRNWNSLGPTMPVVYRTTYLNGDSTDLWDFSGTAPSVVSICLGTNDFSDGDGLKSRLAFDEELFIQKYISFIKSLYGYYPHTKIALLSSPILNGEKKEVLDSCLIRIKQYFDNSAVPKSISLFLFDRTFSSGCDGHPDKNEQIQIAGLLVPFFTNLLKD
ncbi:MAG: SGNH/GDSL hydrolase family protein [Bacteroidales bacterium]|jgi:hypothetical protein